MPRVSVIIPTFNCARYLPAAINSVLEQTYRDHEIIVVDDGSTDKTADAVAPYGEDIRYFYQANAGVSKARNHALDVSTGEFIAYLDADDVWYPKKLERQIAFLEIHAEFGLLHSDVTVIDEEDNVLYDRFNVETSRPVPMGYCIRDLLKRCHIQTPTVIERRGCIDKIGGFDEGLPVTQDYMRWIRISLAGWAIGYIDESLAKYRWRSGSLMSSKRRVLEDHVQMFGVILPHLYGEQYKSIEEAIVRDRFMAAERELAYIDLAEGRFQSGRQRLKGLIQRSPFHYSLYLDLMKNYLSSATSARKLYETLVRIGKE